MFLEGYMKKIRLIAFVLLAATLLTLCGSLLVSAGTSEKDKLIEFLTSAGEGTYKMTKNVTITKTGKDFESFQITGKKTLDLNGYTLKVVQDQGPKNFN